MVAPAKPPLRDFGTDPVSNRAVLAKEGKFGVYVTDGETNASIERVLALFQDSTNVERPGYTPSERAVRRKFDEVFARTQRRLRVGFHLGYAEIAIEDGRKRLLAMILVHDRLYQSDDLTSVEFGAYARSLVSALVATFEHSDRVRVVMQTDDLRLPAELALPSGLMLCELVTNVFKYGYPGDRRGTLRVSIQHQPHATERGDAHVKLIVHDDGVGFPAGFDARVTATFGWHLVSTLAQQLGASFDAGNDDGARVRIRYPIPDRRTTPWSHPSTSRR